MFGVAFATGFSNNLKIHKNARQFSVVVQRNYEPILAGS